MAASTCSGLPEGSAVGFVTGGTMANFTGLAAGRDAVLRRAGWDVATDGLVGSPGVRVLVGAERHDTVDLALRYLGLGTPEAVAADAQGRLDAGALDAALRAGDGRPTIVVLQAGNVHSGAFDPFERGDPARARARRLGARGRRVRPVRGAPRLPGGTSSPATSTPTRGRPTRTRPSTSPTTAVWRSCADRSALKASMGMHGDYLIHDAAGEPFDKVPEISRRGRAIPVWAVLRALGRDGVAALVDRLCTHAGALARRHRGHPRRRGAQRRGVHPGVRDVR